MLQFYKPAKTGRGSAASFQLASKDGAVFVQIVKQTDNPEEPFKNGQKVNIKLGVMELNAICDAIENKIEWSTVHKGEGYSTTINFAPYIVKEEHKGYGLKIYKKADGQEKADGFLIGFNFIESRRLIKWFDFAQEHIDLADYALDKAKAKEYVEKKAKEAVKPAPAPKVETPAETDEFVL